MSKIKLVKNGSNWFPKISTKDHWGKKDLNLCENCKELHGLPIFSQDKKMFCSTKCLESTFPRARYV